MLSQASAHCQVPCGIFEDKARVKGMMGARPTHPPAPHPTHPTCLPVGAEDATTIRKAMVQTSSLSATVAAGDPQGLNQATRWINTKEDHANKILNTTADYFLAQRERDAAPPPPSPGLPRPSHASAPAARRVMAVLGLVQACRRSPKARTATMNTWRSWRNTTW